jgi:serine/threonine-protein kinase
MHIKSKILAAGAVAGLMLASAGQAQAASWGAIYYSPGTGATGWSYGENSENAANRVAYDNCSDSADDCKYAIAFHNACGAVAVGRNGGWGGDWGTSDWDAQQSALGACGEHDSGCKVIHWQCSGAN